MRKKKAIDHSVYDGWEAIGERSISCRITTRYVEIGEGCILVHINPIAQVERNRSGRLTHLVHDFFFHLLIWWITQRRDLLYWAPSRIKIPARGWIKRFLWANWYWLPKPWKTLCSPEPELLLLLFWPWIAARRKCTAKSFLAQLRF